MTKTTTTVRPVGARTTTPAATTAVKPSTRTTLASVMDAQKAGRPAAKKAPERTKATPTVMAAPLPTSKRIVDLSPLEEFDIHPAAALFPMISDSELLELAADIAKVGQIEPIWLYNGQLLDGRNRLVACRHAGITPIVEDWEPGDSDTPVTFVISRNMRRRHLSASERAAVAVRMEKVIASENARLRQDDRASRKETAAAAPGLFSDATSATNTPITKPSAGSRPAAQKQRPASPFGVPKPAAPVAAPLQTGRARSHAADLLGVSTGYVNDAKDLEKNYPEAFESLTSSGISLPAAQAKIVAEAHAAGTLDDVKLRPGVIKAAVTRIEAKQYKKETPTRAAIVIKKFSKATSSKVTISMNVTFGNATIAQDMINQWNNDPKVLTITAEVTG